MKRGQPFWEAIYNKSGNESTFGPPSSEVIDVSKKLSAGARILDIGCGDGRHSLYLAEKGFDVTAIDISAAGINKIQRLAKKLHLAIKTQIIDVRQFEFIYSYDAIIAHGCLHLIPRSDWLRVLNHIKQYTRNLGYNIIVVFSNKIPPPDDLKPFHVGLFMEGELYDIYKDWKIIEARSYILKDEHAGGIRHIHPINKLVARKYN